MSELAIAFAVLLVLAFFVGWLMRPAVPPHDHRVRDHWHPSVEKRLDVIESLVKIDRAAGDAELRMLDELVRHLGNGPKTRP